MTDLISFTFDRLFIQSCFLPSKWSWQMINVFDKNYWFQTMLAACGLKLATFLRLDLNLNTRRQIQFAQCIYSSWRRSVDIQQTLVSSQLKLLTTLLIHVWWTQYSENSLVCRQGNWTSYYGTSAAHCFYDFLSRFIYQIVIVRL